MCYAHLTRAQRYQIEQLLQGSCSVTGIARKLHVHRSTIYRELKRGRRSAEGYLAWYAHESAERRARRSAANHRTKPESLWRLIRRLIRLDWSPEQAQGYLERFGHPLASVPAIYAHVRTRRRVQPLLHEHLRYGKRKYPWGRHSSGSLPVDRHRIHTRPASVERRHTIGHWEGDTLMGHPSSPHRLLSLVERASRFVRLRRPKGGPFISSRVANTATRVLRRVPFRSLTLDNGTEFANYRRIESALSCKVYFADPHSPWQRGTCENTIGLVRQYIPKGSSGAHLTCAQIQRIENKLNHRPRKCLGFKTPAEVLLKAKPPVALRT